MWTFRRRLPQIMGTHPRQADMVGLSLIAAVRLLIELRGMTILWAPTRLAGKHDLHQLVP